MKTLQFVRNTLTAHQNKSEWCGEAPKTLKDELTISSDIYRKIPSFKLRQVLRLIDASRMIQ